MSRDEREWFTRTCYLDEVNEDTLRLWRRRCAEFAEIAATLGAAQRERAE